MINIAICDDDIAITSSLEEKLYIIQREQNININCDIFFDGNTLIKNIKNGTYYDLIYLDIEMPKTNGIDTAQIIRSLEIPALIIYVSNHEKYLKELFATEPFRFLSKPINHKAFYDTFMDAYKRIIAKGEYYTFSYKKSFQKIPVKDICYFESQNRLIYIHQRTHQNIKENLNSIQHNTTEIKFYSKMNDVERQLLNSNNRFIRIHQSYLVNFDYIAKMNFTSVTLINGTVLQISEERQKAVRTQFCTMIGTEMLNDE